MKKKSKIEKLITNKKILNDFIILNKYEAGIILTGTEVKSCKSKNVILEKAYSYLENNEIFINELYISKYEYGNINNHEPNRKRKLLLNKSEILEISEQKKKNNNLYVVALEMYLKNGKIKLSIGIARKKNNIDNRDKIKKQEAKIQILKYKNN